MAKGYPGSRPTCRMDGCEKASRAFGLCPMHESRLRRNGSPLVAQRNWETEERPCFVCGQQERVGIKSRKFCSPRCERHWMRHGGEVPTASECRQCGAAIDLTSVSRKGYRQRASTALCKPCRQSTRWAMTAEELADRDGRTCGICGADVDLTLPYPSDGFATVDHVVPRSAGGPDDGSNLQLAHYRCNLLKSNRVEVEV